MNGAGRGLGYVLLWLATFGALLGGWRLTVYGASLATRDKLARDVADLAQRVRALEATAAHEAQFRAELGAVEAERAELDRVLPKTTNEQAFVLSLDSRARDLNLMVSSLRWEKRQQRDLLSSAPLTLEVRGAFEPALLFASKVAAGDPLVSIQSLQLKRGPLSTLTLKAEALSAPEL